MIAHICETLRNDANTGEECVECGAVYTDLYVSQKWDSKAREIAGPAEASNAPAPLGALPPSHGRGRQDRRPWMRPGWFHVVDMNGHGVGRRGHS